MTQNGYRSACQMAGKAAARREEGMPRAGQMAVAVAGGPSNLDGGGDEGRHEDGDGSEEGKGGSKGIKGDEGGQGARNDDDGDGGGEEKVSYLGHLEGPVRELMSRQAWQAGGRLLDAIGPSTSGIHSPVLVIT